MSFLVKNTKHHFRCSYSAKIGLKNSQKNQPPSAMHLRDFDLQSERILIDVHWRAVFT